MGGWLAALSLSLSLKHTHTTAVGWGNWEVKGVGGDVPWAVSPRTIMAKRACTARSAMSIMSSIAYWYCTGGSRDCMCCIWASRQEMGSVIIRKEIGGTKMRCR